MKNRNNKEETLITKSHMNTKKKVIVNKTASMKNEIVIMRNTKIMSKIEIREMSIETSKKLKKIIEKMNKR